MVVISKSASSRERSCKGRCVDTNKPCDIDWQLDAMGYCDYHSPMALQCRGMARSTGERCRIKWGLNADVLCQYHYWQRVQCHGVSASGSRCGSVRGVNHHGFCAAHPARPEDLLRDFARMALTDVGKKTTQVKVVLKAKKEKKAGAEKKAKASTMMTKDENDEKKTPVAV